MSCISVRQRADGYVQFHLTNGCVSYVMGVRGGKLLNLHTGAVVPDREDFSYLIEDRFRVLATTPSDREDLDSQIRPELLRQEFPEYGRGDYREPAITVLQSNGSRVTDLRYAGYRVFAGKPALEGLPATHAAESAGETEAVDAETLEIALRDDLIGLEVTLLYTIFRDEPVIARSALVRNQGAEPLTIERIASLNLDLPDDDYTMTEFIGAWARERHAHTQPLHPGIQQIASTRGASSPYANPTAIIARPDTNEMDGEAFGLAFVYSGNFDLHAEVDSYRQTRLQLGINPLNFAWHLDPGETFQAPEALLGYTDQGLNAMSQSFHRIVLDHLQRPQWRRRLRPILINNWEATYFDFTEDKLLDLARIAQRQGIELFILDDGWFGARVNDRAGLGDWIANPERLPEGVAGIARKINDLGMQFGLWFEPEMVNEDSDLYRAHPDWMIAAPGRGRSVYRHQYVLNFADGRVVDAVYAQLHAIIANACVAYIKWDMNRFITEAFDATRCAERQGEIFHRYILGVYSLYRRLLEAFPELIIEGCSSGGARFDMGILAYSPQIWTSDDTDAVERLDVQWGTSYFYPVAAMGAHVSITPNHQTGREEPIGSRAAVAMFGTFGYEMDLTGLTDDELAVIAAQVAFFKRHADVVHNGDFYRLIDPASKRRAAWMAVSRDRSEAVVMDMTILMQPNAPSSRLRLQGLRPDAEYRVLTVDLSQRDYGLDEHGCQGGTVRTGAELMRIGIDDSTVHTHDFASRIYLVTEVGK